MSRPIKFRLYVWENDFKQKGNMVCWEDLLAEDIERLSCVFSTEFSNASELMEFTGLRDKHCNGKEVYEFDIVEWYGDTRHQGVVEFSNGAFVVKSEDFEVSLMAVIRWGGEVIGNVYDDRELSKEVE